MQWLADNSAALQVITGAVMAIVWIVYLQLLLMTIMRQRRPLILIGTGAGVGLESHCFVSNLGYEPIYVMDLTITLTFDQRRCTAFITDRWEMRDEDLKNPRDATNRGPLQSGRHFNVGRFGDLLERAKAKLGIDDVADEVRLIELTVIANTAASTTIIAARRSFVCESFDGRHRLVPASIDTRQVRSFRERRRLKQELQERLEAGEAGMTGGTQISCPSTRQAADHQCSSRSDGVI